MCCKVCMHTYTKNGRILITAGWSPAKQKFKKRELNGTAGHTALICGTARFRKLKPMQYKNKKMSSTCATAMKTLESQLNGTFQLAPMEKEHVMV